MAALLGDSPRLLRPTMWEVLWGWLPGLVPVRSADFGRGSSPLETLRRRLAADVAAGPCFVAFSGGRDSSCVLATATDVARREGLPLPVPVTMRFPMAPASDETAWQQDVLRHLGLRDWITLDLVDEVDLVGPVARASLRDHGILWPSTAHVRGPLFETVHGGVLLTGNGGDELFGPHRARAFARLLGRPRRGLRASTTAAVRALRPYRLRKRELARRLATQRPWLREHAVRLLVDALDEELRTDPWRWRDAVRRVPLTRSWVVGSHNLGAIAAASQVHYRSPLLDPSFVQALSDRHGTFGPTSRAEIMEELFGDLLPRQVLHRKSKARFNEVAAGADTRRFVAAWDGSGVPHEHVDVQRLREEWSSPLPSAATFLLLQYAWTQQHWGPSGIS